VQITSDVSFREAVDGCAKNLTFYASTLCDSCSKLVHPCFNLVALLDIYVTYYSFCCYEDGSGMPPGVSPQVCSGCNGTGMVGSYTVWHCFLEEIHNLQALP
jgi:DnaJ-class molecular chaperone